MKTKKIYRKWIYVAIVIIIASSFLIFTGCSRQEILCDSAPCYPEGTNNFNPDIADANNNFAFDLYFQYKKDNENIFFSPYSISSAFEMVYEGAKGKTAEEIQKVFSFETDDSTRRRAFAGLYSEINKKNKNYKLNTANGLWAQKDYAFLNDYFNTIKSNYDGKIENLDFVNDNENSRKIINNWVEKQTNDKIKNLIPAGMLDASTRLVLTNAIYFKGKWQIEFDKSDTRDMNFLTNSGKDVKVNMMSLIDSKKNFGYFENDDLQALELPYKDNELSMTVLLPKNDNIDLAEKYLDAGKFANIEKNMRNMPIDIYLPKFKFETKYFMQDNLKKMGIEDAFSKQDADFSGMTGSKDLFISDVIHQAFVEVNEEGTEAAAATAVTMKFTSAIDSDKLIFRADHPFVFLIKQKSTGAILFIGKVNNPNNN